MAEIVEFTRKMMEVADQPDVDESRLGDCPLCRHAIIEGSGVMVAVIGKMAADLFFGKRPMACR